MLPNLGQVSTLCLDCSKRQAIPELEKALTGCHLLGVGGPLLLEGLELVVLVSVIKN